MGTTNRMWHLWGEVQFFRSTCRANPKGYWMQSKIQDLTICTLVAFSQIHKEP